MLSGRLIVLALVFSVAWLIGLVVIAVWSTRLSEYERMNFRDQHDAAYLFLGMWWRLTDMIPTAIILAGLLYLLGL